MAKKKNNVVETTKEETNIVLETPVVSTETTPTETIVEAEVEIPAVIEEPIVEVKKEKAEAEVKKIVTDAQEHFNKKITAHKYYEIYFRGMCIYKANTTTSPLPKENALYINNIPYPYNSIEVKY